MTHSFPTRRSSDLTICPYALAGGGALFTEKWKLSVAGQASILALGLIFGDSAVRWRPIRRGISRDEPYLCAFRFAVGRSEEHTSELQSLMRISYAVFCLKKKLIQTNTTTDHHTSHFI